MNTYEFCFVTGISRQIISKESYLLSWGILSIWTHCRFLYNLCGVLYCEQLSSFSSIFLCSVRDLSSNEFSGRVPAAVGDLEHLLTL